MKAKFSQKQIKEIIMEELINELSLGGGTVKLDPKETEDIMSIVDAEPPMSMEPSAEQDEVDLSKKHGSVSYNEIRDILKRWEEEPYVSMNPEQRYKKYYDDLLKIVEDEPNEEAPAQEYEFPAPGEPTEEVMQEAILKKIISLLS